MACERVRGEWGEVATRAGHLVGLRLGAGLPLGLLLLGTQGRRRRLVGQLGLALLGQRGGRPVVAEAELPVGPGRPGGVAGQAAPPVGLSLDQHQLVQPHLAETAEKPPPPPPPPPPE